MQSHCPACGSAAKQTSRTNHTIECQEFAFQCGNSKCGKEFIGVLTLSLMKVPGAHNFRQGATAEPSAIETDC